MGGEACFAVEALGVVACHREQCRGDVGSDAVMQVGRLGFDERGESLVEIFDLGSKVLAAAGQCP